MKNTPLAKTLTASLPRAAQDIFSFICDPEHLPLWHSSFCRVMRKEGGSFIADTPRGPVPLTFIRNDPSLVLDVVMRLEDGVELTHAIRILANGDHSEMIWTLIKPQGLGDPAFHEQLRWAGSALHALRKAPAVERPVDAPAAPVLAVAPDPLEPLQAPSPAEISSMPLSGKKLFIGNLAYDWTDDQLRAHFSEQGTVALAEIARFRGRGGRSRGFGFVEMATEAEAQNAIEKLHGGLAGGRQIIVRIAKSQESRPAKTAETLSETPSPSDAPEPGNERSSGSASSSRHRSRTERPRRGMPPRPAERAAAPRRLGGGRAPRPGGVERPYREQDISNKSGYEIFPRRASGSPEPARTSAPESAPTRPQGEASPYMDDTGDIENHGHRPPRHRRPDRSR